MRPFKRNFSIIYCKIISLVLLLVLVNLSLCSAEDLDTILGRRLQDIISANDNPDQANQWKVELTSEGNWTDVDYTAGCPARRANWPAQEHFHRIITMATLWNSDKLDAELLSKISLALDYWFDRDFTEDDCINAGGRDDLKCPCGTPGFWNSNWYDQMILIPGLVGSACLLLTPDLTPTQLANCTIQMSRAFVRIDGDPNGSMGPMTGANMLDVSSTGVSLALLTSDSPLLEDALGRYYSEAQIMEAGADGIQIDGSYMQHSSQIYTGNYGSVFMRTLLKIFIQTGDTELGPPPSVQDAFLTVINGSEWFIYAKSGEQLSWQYSVIGRMVSHKHSDWNGIGLNLDELLLGTGSWPNAAAFQEIVERLRNTRKGDRAVNPGPLVGTRYFHISDYLIHRGLNYIVALKMYSSRTTNSECNNNQNPYGFHLSDGTIYTHLTGNEYTDVYGAWDWNLIPGTTVDYEGTPLACSNVQTKGKEDFVGGLGHGEGGLAVMKYTNPKTGSLSWTKTFFFFPNTYISWLGEVQAETGNRPIITTLDQRQRSGPIYVDGELVQEELLSSKASTLWHDRVGYTFPAPVDLTVDTRLKTSNWSEIGISVGNETQALFAAYITHPLDNSLLSPYTVRLDIDQEDFAKENGIGRARVLAWNGRQAAADVKGAAYGEAGGSSRIISLAFWSSGEFETGLEDIVRVEASEPVLLQFHLKGDSQGWSLVVADPTQALAEVNVKVLLGGSGEMLNLNVQLPEGLWAGSSVVIEL